MTGSAVRARFPEDLQKAEDETSEIALGGPFFRGDEGRKTRGLKLYSVLSSYPRNRPLKVLRSVEVGIGTKFKIKKSSNGSSIGWVPGYEQRSIVDGLRLDVREASVRV